MQEMWVKSLVWEDPLDKEMAIHSSILQNPTDRGAWWAIVHGVTKDSDMTEKFNKSYSQSVPDTELMCKTTH